MKRRSSRQPRDRTTGLWLLLTGMALTVFLVTAPTFGGWGLAHYGAVSIGVRLGLAVAAVVGAMLLWNRRHAAAAFRALSRSVPPGVLLPVILVLCVVLRERYYIGDWINLAFALPAHPDWMLQSDVLWRAPLVNLLQYVQWMVVLKPIVRGDSLLEWQILLAAYGVVILMAQWWIGKAAFGSTKSSVLYMILFATSGVVFFCLGHVENYPVSMAILALASWRSIAAIRTGRGGALAFLLYGAAAMAHPQSIIFAPAMAVVWFSGLSKGHVWRYTLWCVGAMLAIPVALGVLGWAIGSPPSLGAVSGGNASGTLLPPGKAFASDRLRELLMILLRMAPALPAIAVGTILWRRRLPLRDPVGLWFSINAAAAFCYCLFIWNQQPLETDWDLMGLSILMIWMAACYVVVRGVPRISRIRAVLCLAVLTLPHTALWLSWNLVPDPRQQVEIRQLQDAIDRESARRDSDSSSGENADGLRSLE